MAQINILGFFCFATMFIANNSKSAFYVISQP